MTPEPAPALSPYRDALQRLASVQKTGKGAPAYSRWVNRWMGRRFAARAYVMGMTPNQVTVLSAAFTFSAILALALVPASAPLGFVVAGLLVMGYALDSADGQLARLRGGGSPAGEWLDHCVDALKTVTLHAAVLIGLYRFGDLSAPAWLLVPLAYGAVGAFWFFAVWLTDGLRRAHHAAVGTPVVPAGYVAPVWRSLVVLPTDYGVLILWFCTWGWTTLFLLGYTALLLGTVLFLCAAVPTWYREMKSFSRPPAAVEESVEESA